MGDPRNDATADEVVNRLSAEFGPKHDLMQEHMAALREEFATRLDGFERRLDGLERKAGYNFLLDKARAAAAAEAAAAGGVPDPGTSRPAAIDRACATDPAEPVMVLVPEFGRFGLEVEPEPGSDPGAVWPEVVRAINAEGGNGEVRRPRRARRH